MFRIRGPVAALVVCLCVRICAGQQGGAVVESTLPDGPKADSNASLTGVITDQEGGLLPGAHVEVTASGRTTAQLADSSGTFHVYGLAAGHYTVRAAASGFEAEVEEGTLATAEQKELEPLALPATVATSVSVVASSHDIAVAQLAAEEKQRVLGVIPNFYVVYFRNPAPLTTKQKFHLAWRSTLDPVSFLGSGVAAGIEQATGGVNGWGYDGKGYAQRYGANFADGAVSTFLGGAILPVIFHQDPRYYWQGTGTKTSRAKHAIASVFVCRGDDGRREFNYSSVLGNFASAGISNLYYPAANRNGAGLTLTNAALGSAFGAFAAIMQEFVVPKLTPHRPASAPLPDPIDNH
ncbi:carboxypeptidase-like regulatory domain-containing protein [Terriglobus roseus]|uniref:Carboxypeptidase regulatory-like domain-containing protein n=1 Tax=Terriglobus roseus TaxID=392734 RepID=A0A1H4KYK9_9BACT|nr:carboxypeptidase-like regulatory domain-containing protein [Terriglobus roseus]SEB63042.1 Carboxypeptidase regulatory-like domain-containing protein [Terriglobus roseus]